ncbi:short-chain dehydrogenase/reductase SDR [Arthrobacter crystallopoietes BAB-32]|uniref:Short-chain dehydrogenase/reductase SDR n=1 Tax=Arthrobacter crystallopoietes BAB-32 TaxID=1246476 RepID=N1V1M5_9MICC|nr:SDR family NAD(P)-dependent oxidoreductase [Arthrobacter crystallopoietes]EMY33894.1 short-chain dehydrogenase/reductase SDR [Arthrobacter crystallopoietes BAB-32]
MANEHDRTEDYGSPKAGTALITGATAGLGAEFAQQLAARGFALVLVARNAERLASSAASLGQRFGVPVETITADLVTDAGIDLVAGRLAATDRQVTMLVNNAGYGLLGNFADNELEDELKHLRIHIEAPMRLCHAALTSMAAAGGGRIINVASMAAYIPRGSYSAAKALMVNFSRWAGIFYRDRGISVTALCPGYVHTEFHDRMRLDKKTIPAFAWLNPEQVVREALRDAEAGKPVSIPSLKYKAAAAVARFLPDRVLERIARREQ